VHRLRFASQRTIPPTAGTALVAAPLPRPCALLGRLAGIQTEAESQTAALTDLAQQYRLGYSQDGH
jgi:hypothetical protein